MRAACYLRCSTDDQAQRQLPIDGQRDACLELIRTRGWLPAAEYQDPGISGTLGPDRRPGLRSLLETAHRGELDAVVLWDDSRLARDDRLAGWLRWELREVQIITVTSPDASALETGLRSIVAAEQVRQIRAATSRGVRANMRRGGRHGSDALGYRWVEGRRIIDPDGAAIIRDVYARVLRGESIRSICRHTGWHSVILLFRLRSPVYAGARVIGRRVGPNSKRVAVPREQWEILWDQHEPIVPRADWDRVQAILDGHKGQPREGRVALSGLLHCGPCNERMYLRNWRDVRGGRRFWFRCGSCEGRTGLLGETRRIAQQIATEITVPDLAERIAADLAAAYSAGESAGAAKAEIRRLTRARDALLELIVSGSVTDTSALGARLEGIQRDLKAAEARLKECSRARALPTVEEIRAKLLEIAGDLAAVADHPLIDYAARPLLHALVDRIDVSEESLIIHPGEIVAGQGPLASLGFTWTMERRAA